MTIKFLLFVSLLPLQADEVIDFCQAISRDPSGVDTPATCHSGFPVAASITGSGRNLDIHLLNYAYNTVQGNSPNAVVDLSLERSASVSQDFVISGSTGQGDLFLEGLSDAGWWFPRGVGVQFSFTSNFLPAPPRLAYWGTRNYHPFSVPFTFDVPFTLSLESDIRIWALAPFTKQGLAWEGLQQWDLHLEDIVDSSGHSVPSAQISEVPEPWSITLLATCLACIGFIGRQRAYRPTP